MNFEIFVIFAFLLGTNMCQSVLPTFPCVFPTCDLPPPHCKIVKDQMGCPTCNYVCEYGPFVCPEVICTNYCPDGYSMDHNGCQSCSCKTLWQPAPPPPQRQLDCHTWLQCPQGVCPDSCDCQPNCVTMRRPFPPRGREREGIYGEEPYEL